MDKELIAKYVDSVANGQPDPSAFKSISVAKIQEILSARRLEANVSAVKESYNRLLTEFGHDVNNRGIDIAHDGTIKIGGKVVGKVVTDMSDFNSGINFVSADGRFSKEFDTIEQLNAFLVKSFGAR